MSWVIIILSYFIGAIPTGYIAGHMVRGVDIRRVGDENMGAANVYRELGPKAGILVGLIDAAKGAVSVLIAQAAGLVHLAVLACGLASVIGHNLPVFIGFRGGRGVSTTIGILLVLVTKPMLILALPTILILIWRRSTTPACAFLFIALPLVSWWQGVSALLIGYGIALPALVGVTHYFRVRQKVAHHA